MLNRKQAREKMSELSASVLATQTTEQVFIKTDDNSVFYFSCCYASTVMPYVIVIPEHHEPCLFHMEEVTEFYKGKAAKLRLGNNNVS